LAKSVEIPKSINNEDQDREEDQNEFVNISKENNERDEPIYTSTPPTLEQLGNKLKELEGARILQEHLNKSLERVGHAHLSIKAPDQLYAELSECTIYISLLSLIVPEHCPATIVQISNPFDRAGFVIRGAEQTGIPPLFKQWELVTESPHIHKTFLACLLTALASQPSVIDEEPAQGTCCWSLR